ncbi:hypothetical protein HYW75_04680 [Candidatus Pacearchaeota archaeon]|nr:hypothetical protein [Candidatus Pacearchaeota archaeon]
MDSMFNILSLQNKIKNSRRESRIINALLILLMVIFAFVIGSAQISALGITPGRININYEEGKEVSGGITIVNTENKDIDVVIIAQGEFNQSVKFSEVSFKMKSSEREKRIQYTFNMPSQLSPGPHIGEILAVQVPSKTSGGETSVGATVAVATQIHVFVPYPNKYAEASLDIVSDNLGKITFVIPVINRGKLDLVRVRANIDIYGNLNEKVDSFNTNQVEIKSGERREIAYTWNSNVTSGRYRAVATVLYDEETLRLEREFSVGKPILDLQQIEVNDFTLGEIAKFEMLVENQWSEEIKGAYAEMEIYNPKNEVMADIKSQTYDFSPLSKKTMVSYWDTGGVKKGIYDSSVYLRYGAQSTQKDFKLDVKEDSITAIGVGYVISAKTKSGSSTTTILLIGIVVLILINLGWFLVLRKYMHKKK